MVQLGLTGLVGFLAALQPAIAAPQPKYGNSDPTTCLADGKLYRSGRTYRMNGGDYIVRCARGSSGNIVANQKVMRGGFATCFDVCQRRKDCAGFTYVGNKDSGNCSLKSNIGGHPVAGGDTVTCEKNPNGPPGKDPEPLPSSSSVSSQPASTTSSSSLDTPTSRSDLNTFSRTDASTSSSAPTPSASSQCQEAVKAYGDVYRKGSGSAYQLSCGTDHYGGDLTDAGSESFLGCIAVCDARPDCIGYAYTPGNCYLKSYLTDMQVNPGVDFAINLERNSTAKPRPSTTASPTSTTPTVKPTPIAGSCGYISGTSYESTEKVRYTIECGADHNGGDIGASSAARFVDCMDICDKTDKCIAYAWVGGNGPGTCYLKGAITGRESPSDVDYAYKDAATYLPGSSSSTSSATREGAWGSTKSESSTVVVSTSSSPPKETTSSSQSKSGTKTIVVTSTQTANSTSSAPISTSTATDKPTKSVPAWTRHTKSKTHHTKSDPHHTKTHHTKTHHTKSRHTKSHHTKSTTIPATLITSTVPADNSVSTSCRTITFSTSGTTSVSTVTDYISKSYTHVHWITSTTGNSSATAPTTTPPASTTPKSTTTPEQPTRTYTEHPVSPTPVGHGEYCRDLREVKQPRKLRVNVLRGNQRFQDMWVSNPLRKHTSNVELCKRIEDAASIFLNPSTNSLAAWLDKETCDFWGMQMLPAPGGLHRPKDGKHNKHHGPTTGEVVFAPNEGSSYMFNDIEGVTWHHERFVGWLVCPSGRRARPELSYIDGYGSNKDKGHPIGDECAHVQLVLVK